MNDIDKMPSKCRDCAYWELATYPWYCGDCKDIMNPKNGEYIKRIDAKRALTALSADLDAETVQRCIEAMNSLKAADVEPKRKWIPVTERPPKDNVPVNVVWVNHDPEVYYTDIKDKSFTATAVYFRKRWYWWSETIEDILNEYGDIPQLRMDPGIEITHWSPIPEPPKEEDNDNH